MVGKSHTVSNKRTQILVVLLAIVSAGTYWLTTTDSVGGEGNHPVTLPDGNPIFQTISNETQVTIAKEATALLPQDEPVDWSAYPRGLGVLGQHHLMHPVDVSDWPVDIGARRQLFIDKHIVHTVSDLTSQWHRPIPHPNNPLLKPEKPWEKEKNEGFGVDLLTVLRDPKTGNFMMWYDVTGFS